MSSGFFKRQDRALQAPIRTVGCASCGLSSGCLHPKMEPTGHGRKKVLIVAEAPGEDEDRLGTQLIGRVGQYLRKTLRDSFGVDLDRDCRKTNSVRCRPPDNREPDDFEVECCRKHVFDEIARSRPMVIIPLGGSALRCLLGGRWRRDSNLTISRWRGLTIPDHELGAWLCPTFHPSYVTRQLDYAPATAVIWRRDLGRALGLWDEPLPKPVDPDVRFLRGPEVAEYLLDLWRRAKAPRRSPFAGLSPGTEEWMECWRRFPRSQEEMLEYAKNPEQFAGLTPSCGSVRVAFDYETTGLKPYREGHRILCCSMAEGRDVARAWMMADLGADALQLYREVMEAQEVRKVAGNMKFEHVWTRATLGFEVHSWYWDTVLAAKTLDNRPGNSNVKFQAYARLGVPGYDDEVKAHIGARDSNAFNRMAEVPPKDLMTYCAWDSAVEYALMEEQRKEVYG